MNKEWVEVVLDWHPFGGHIFFPWDQKNCVYAYHVGSSIPYIGEAVYCTVGERYRDHQHDGVSDRLRSEFPSQNFNVIVGNIRRKDGKSVSPSLIHDIESVLIYKRQPSANISKMKSIGVDYPLTIECQGAWPNLWDLYHHDGKVVSDPQAANFLSQALAFGRMATPTPFGLSSLFSDLSPTSSLPRMGAPTPPAEGGALRRMADLLRTPNRFAEPDPLALQFLSRMSKK